MIFTECFAFVALAAARATRWRPYWPVSCASLSLTSCAALVAGAYVNPADVDVPNKRGEQGFNDDAPGAIIRVLFETYLSDVEIAVYPVLAPISAGNFLGYVDAGHYDEATIYRAARKSAVPSIYLIRRSP